MSTTSKKIGLLLSTFLLFLSGADFFAQCSLQPFYLSDLNRPAFSSGNYTSNSMVVDPSGNVYMALADGTSVLVRKYNGSSWNFVGGTYIDSVAYGFNSATIQMDNSGNLYVGCIDMSTNQGSVYKYNGTAWSPVGNLRFTGSNIFGLTLGLDGNNTPYVCYNDGSQSNKLSVMKFDGTNWVAVGSLGFSTTSAVYSNIVLDKNNVPYVSYIDNGASNKANVVKFNGSSWIALGGANFTSGAANGLSLAINSSNQPYVLYSDGSNSSKATVQMFDGTNWLTVGSAGISSGGILSSGCKIALNSTDVPYISYTLSTGRKISVMQYSGGTWNFVGSANFFSGGPAYQKTTCLGFDNTGAPYYGFVEGVNLKAGIVKKFNGSSWVTLGNSGVAEITSDQSDICVDPSGNVYVAASDPSNSNKLNVYKNVAGTWVPVGLLGFSAGAVSNVDIEVSSSGYLYVAYTDGSVSSKLTVQKFDGSNWSVLGIAGISAGAAYALDLTLDKNDVPYVVYGDDGLGITVNVKSFNGSSWNVVGSSSLVQVYNSSGACSLTFNSLNEPAFSFIYTNSNVGIYKFTSGSWTLVPLTGINTANASLSSLSYDKYDNLYFAYTDYFINAGSASVIKNVSGTWSYVGTVDALSGTSFTVNNLNLNIDPNTNQPVLSFHDSNNSFKGEIWTFNGSAWAEKFALVGSGDVSHNAAVIDNTGAMYLLMTEGGLYVYKTSLSTTSSISSASACVGGSVTITASGGSNYNLSGPYSSTSATNVISPLTLANTGTYTMVVSETGCSRSIYTYSLTVNNLPVVTANSTATVVCQGNNVTLSGGGASTYTWSNGVNNGIPFTAASSGVYTVTGTDANNCVNTATVSLTVNALPSVSVSATATVVCQGAPVTLTGSGALTYTWSNGVSNGSPFTPSATNTYTLNGTDANGCVNSALKTITVNALPNVIANATANSVCQGSSVTLSGSGAISYTWTGGITDGVAFIPASTSTYTVTGTDANGCTNSAIKNIAVNSLPHITVNSTQSSICLGGSVTLSGSGALTYTWTGGIGNGVPFNPSSSQNYTVTGTDLNGCMSTAATAITVYNLPVISIQASDTAICYGKSVTLTAAGAASYIWNNGIVNGISFSPSTSNSYTVTGTDNNGCTGTNSIAVTVNQLPVIGNVTTSNALCGSNNGSASASVTGGHAPYHYAWSNGDTSSTASNLSAGQYQLQAVDSKGCIAFSVVSVNATNGPSISMVSTASVTCNGGSNGSASINISGGTQPYTTLWSTGANTAAVSGLTAGPYEVTVTDANDCAATYTLVVSQPASLSNSFSISPSQCASSTGAATAITNGGTAPYTYQWDNNAGNQNTATAINLAAGIYSVTIQDAFGCTLQDIATVNNSATSLTGTIGSITAGNCGFSPGGSAMMLASNGVGTYSYLWNTGVTSNTISGLQPGTYYCTVTDGNLCSFTQSVVIPSTTDGLQQNLCLVTVDTGTFTNKIVWEKTITHDIKAFNIYRESTIQNVYSLIASVPYNVISEYTDSVANPAIHAWRYKITAMDSCNKETPYSSAHKTIHLSQNLGIGGEINLLWDQYEGFNYYTYYIWRYDPITNWMLIDSLSTNFTSYTDFTPPSANSRYMIEVIPPTPCNSSYRAGAEGILTAVVKSRSNIKTQRTNGHTTSISTSGSPLPLINVYPNPTTGEFTILTDEAGNTAKPLRLIIYNALGEVVMNEPVVSNKTKFRLPDSNNPGAYFITLTNAAGKMIGRKVLIKQ